MSDHLHDGKHGRGRTLAKVPCYADRSSRSIDKLTVGKRWRLQRNLIIFVAYSGGVSQRMLGRVFDLRHSRICRIIQEMKETHAKQERPPE